VKQVAPVQCEPATSSFVTAVIEAAFFGFRPSAVMINAPTGMAPASGIIRRSAPAYAPARALPRRQ
jgi:hypothetical protein